MKQKVIFNNGQYIESNIGIKKLQKICDEGLIVLIEDEGRTFKGTLRLVYGEEFDTEMLMYEESGS